MQPRLSSFARGTRGHLGRGDGLEGPAAVGFGCFVLFPLRPVGCCSDTLYRWSVKPAEFNEVIKRFS
ncbi:hypothetical protein APED_11345 [Acanthopleuribacter pedis]